MPEHHQYQYADGQGNTQKSISDIKAWPPRVSMRSSSSPTPVRRCCRRITSVYKSGKVIVPYRVEAGGKAGMNYTKYIGTDSKNDGANWGNWIKGVLPNGGNVLFMSGPAGNSQGLDELKV